MIVVIGASGNMGRRYTVILESLGEDYVGFDKDDSEDVIMKACLESNGVIIATPTNNHIYWLDKLVTTGVPILCEKPLSTNIVELRDRLSVWNKIDVKLRMVNQYREISHSSAEELSSYNYWKHGNDGLAWDCISIIRLAAGDYKLEEDSPVWDCSINGEKIKIQDMDLAYVKMIQGWTTGDHRDDMMELLDAHEAASAIHLRMGTDSGYH